MIYSFTFDIKPKSKERPRFSNKNGVVRTYTAPKTRAFEADIAWQARKQMGPKPILKGLLSATVLFEFKKPTKTKFLAPRSDIDNLQKSLFDSLNKIVFDDDSQICKLKEVEKRWSTRNQITMTIGDWE